MEKFRVNLDRPEPDRAKIQAKKDFNTFHSTNFPKATLFQSKWFWGVSGIATIAMVVTVSLSSFSKNGQDVIANNESKSSIEVLSSAPVEDLFVSKVSTAKKEVYETTGKEVSSEKKPLGESTTTALKEDISEVIDEKLEQVDIAEVKESELFELDFDPLDFPDLKVGNNLFSIDASENTSSEILFSQEWDGVELNNIKGILSLVLSKNGKIYSYKVNQFNK